MKNSLKKNRLQDTPTDVDQSEGKPNTENTTIEPFILEEKQKSLSSDESSINHETSEPLNIDDSPILSNNIAPDLNSNDNDLLKVINIQEDHFSEDYKMEAKKTTDSDQ